MITRSITYLIIIIGLFSCKKKETDGETPKGPISNVPSITLIDVSPKTVQEYKDSIVFVIQYLDGDGDLGTEDADTKSLFLTDNRASLTESYHLPPLAIIGTEMAIQGNLNVVLNSTALLNSTGSSETTTYSIYLVDRAGNSSNTVTSETITITQ